MIRLKGGRVIDPEHDRDEVGDIFIDGDRVVASAESRRDIETIDVAGKVVMAGGIDIHSHIASGNVDIARLMLPERRADRNGEASAPAPCPSAFETGCLYAQMGYTLVVDPAVNPRDALHAHLQLALTPVIDRAALLILGNEDALVGMLRDGESADAVQDYMAAVLGGGRGLGVKVINAGGATAFKENVRAFNLDDVVPSYGVTSRSIVSALRQAVEALGLPHRLHVHCNNLGLAGSAATALATVDAAEGQPLHLAHLQFYGYGTEGKHGISSGALALAEKVNATPNVTVDVGQVMFGPTVTVSSDTLRQFGQKAFARPKKWTLWEGDGNGGGIFPIVYSEREFTAALQWAIGLELFLLIGDPWQVYFTTDHPNGAHFTRYPEILYLLMSAEERGRWIERLPESAIETTTLREIKREYSLAEVATMTRAAPARLLGLSDRGHLGAGALADIAVYEDTPDRTKMFRRAHLVLKSGEVVVRDGEVVNPRPGRTLSVPPALASGRWAPPGLVREWDGSAGRFDVTESAIAAAVGVERIFEEVACRS